MKNSRAVFAVFFGILLIAAGIAVIFLPGADKHPESGGASSEEETKISGSFSDRLGASGYTEEDLEKLGCRQLIIVSGEGTEADVSMYKKGIDGKWSDQGLYTRGFIGRNGMSDNVTEGSLKTPIGLFEVGDAFYIDDKPETGLNSFRITEGTYWINDPGSLYYNKRMTGTDKMDWKSAEDMYRIYPAYKYGFVIEYNTKEVIPGKGSAIFFHIDFGPTAGCVGVSEEMMVRYLKYLDRSENPYILLQRSQES